MRNAPYSIDVDVVHECAVIRAGVAGMLDRLPGSRASLEAACPADYMRSRTGADARVAIVSPAVAEQLMAQTHLRLGIRLIVIAPAFGDLTARTALRNGVMGLLLLSVEPDELSTAVRRVFLGDHHVTSSVAARIAAHLYAESLTLREQEILSFLSDGWCNKSIANELGIAVGTVKTHVKAILSKLDVGSRTEAVVVASRRGIVDGNPLMTSRSQALDAARMHA